MRVDSVTSTCLRSRLGDIRDRSAPIVPGSSGALSGQTDSTRGVCPAAEQPKRISANQNTRIDGFIRVGVKQSLANQSRHATKTEFKLHKRAQSAQSTIRGSGLTTCNGPAASLSGNQSKPCGSWD